MKQQMNEQLPQLEAPKRSGLLLGAGLSVLLAAAAFFSGIQIGSETRLEAGIGSLFAAEPAAEEAVDLDDFWRVWELLDDKFVASTSTDPLTDEERIHGAIDGLVETYGDPYTVFLPPVDAAAFEEDIQGNFGGVGMEVGIRDDVVTVISPLPNTPAEQAGLASGDKIIKIDEVSTEDMNIDAAVKLIRGEKGTAVRLTIFREGESEFLEIEVVRDTISIPTIETEIQGDVFIIRLFSFNALAEAKVQDALREFVESDAAKLVVDLRGNPGGFLQSAVSISGFFLPTGKVVVRESFGNGADEQLYRSQGKILRGFAPEQIVVLVDGGSASASEILAGALSQHGAATLIGENTFGKGSVQELVDLSDGSSVKITVARWLTPNGTSISHGGLAPDIEIIRTPQQRIDEIDPQLEAALKFLGGMSAEEILAEGVPAVEESEEGVASEGQ